MDCPLIREFERQFFFGDYVSSSQRRCRILQRIDDVARISRWDIDIPERRLRMLEEIKPAYDVFDAYIDEDYPHLKTVGRHGTCYATLEWYGLHLYLMVNGVTVGSVNRYIAADKFDRSIFHAARMSGEFVFFSKRPQIIDEALYDASVAPRYGPLAKPAAMPEAMPVDPPEVISDVIISNVTDPLVSLMTDQIFFGHYASDSVQLKLRALERIDMAAGDAPIDELSDRQALADKLWPLYDTFRAYLLRDLPEVYEEGRNGVVPASIEWHALHLYLVEHGFTADAVAQFIAEDRRNRETFHEMRLVGQYIYYGKCPMKLDPAKYPASVKRYSV
jgi:hypothetical protein